MVRTLKLINQWQFKLYAALGFVSIFSWQTKCNLDHTLHKLTVYAIYFLSIPPLSLVRSCVFHLILIGEPLYDLRETNCTIKGNLIDIIFVNNFFVSQNNNNNYKTVIMIHWKICPAILQSKMVNGWWRVRTRKKQANWKSSRNDEWRI